MPLQKQFKKIAQLYVEKFGHELQILSSQPLAGGCISIACKLETNQGTFFLKQNNQGPTDMFIREAEALHEMQKQPNNFINFPTPLLATEIGFNPGFLLTTYLQPGSTGNDDENLGRGIAQMHRTISNSYGFAHNNYCGSTPQNNSYKQSWVEFFTENRLIYLVNLIKASRNWSSTDQHLFEKYIVKLPQLIGHNTQPSLVHGDLWSGNYMFTQTGPALIDPAASYSDREFEMGIMNMFGGFSQRVYDAYNEAWLLPQGWQQRMLIYQSYHVLNHYYLFGGYYKEQALGIMKKYV